jgi:nitroimidazol reductase NimA-like FMN-containing flavoprotein (pyridoxamine 5'-phosphate oxidase superfamily)
MTNPQATRPHFPTGYLEAPQGFVPWEQVSRELAEALHYWFCSVQPDGRPHVVPKWGAWVDEHFYCDGSSETRHARNIAVNPAVAVHLENGERVVILNGHCRTLSKPTPDLAAKIAAAYTNKYALLGYSPQPDQWDNGGLFEVTPISVLAWTKFTEDPTKFTF